MKGTSAPAVEALLFDLGGVVVEIDFGRAIAAWARWSSLPVDELRRRFRHDEAYERHERGEIDAAAYYDHLASTLQLHATPDQIEAGWNAIFVGEIPDTIALVQAARALRPCFAFTNTNARHMAAWSARYPRVVAAFDRIFASHEIGLRKPERAAFERVCALAGVAPAATLFFDDLAENVHGAEAAGLQARLVRSTADVAEALRALGPPPGGRR